MKNIMSASGLRTAAKAISDRLNGLPADGGVAIANVDFEAILRVSLRAIDATASDGPVGRLWYKVCRQTGNFLKRRLTPGVF
jgi:hypothetical protein